MADSNNGNQSRVAGHRRDGSDGGCSRSHPRRRDSMPQRRQQPAELHSSVTRTANPTGIFPLLVLFHVAAISSLVRLAMWGHPSQLNNSFPNLCNLAHQLLFSRFVIVLPEHTTSVTLADGSILNRGRCRGFDGCLRHCSPWHQDLHRKSQNE